MDIGGSDSASTGNQKMFMAVIIISILGLALFFTFPWVTVEKKFEDEKRYTCQDCGYSSEEEYAFTYYSDYDYECPECDSNNVKETDLSGTKQFHFNYDLKLISGEKDDWGDDELYPSGYGAGKVKSFTKGTIWLSFWGLLFSLVLVIILMGLQRYRPIQGIYQYYKPLILVIFSMVLLVLSLIILTSGLRFMDMKIQELHQEQISQQLGGEVNEHQYHIGSYIMLTLGGILLGIAIFTLKMNLKTIQQRFRSQPKMVGMQTRKLNPKSLLNNLLILTVLALIFIPLFPYFGMTSEQEKWSDDYDSEPEKVKITDFSYGSPFILEVAGGYLTSSYSNISDDLWAISTLTWLSLIFLSLGFIGLAIFTMNRWKFAYVTLFLIAAIGILLLAIITVAYHGLMIKDIYEFQNEINDGGFYSDSGNEIIYAYNYFPFIFSLLILIISIFFLIGVVRLSKETYLDYMRNQRPFPYVPPSHTEPYPQRQPRSAQPSVPPPPTQQPPPPQPQQGYSTSTSYGVEPRTRMHEYDRGGQGYYEPPQQYPASGSDFRYDRQNSSYRSVTPSYSTSYQQQGLYCPICNGHLEKSMYGNYCTRCKKYS